MLVSKVRVYRLPAWASLAYTNVNQVAIDVTLPIAGGVLNTNLVLARAIPRCTIVQCQASGADRLALTFTTDAGHRYRVMRSGQLVPGDWQAVNHARGAGDPLALETLAGSGAAETVYVERPAVATAFFRVKVE